MLIPYFVSHYSSLFIHRPQLFHQTIHVDKKRTVIYPEKPSLVFPLTSQPQLPLFIHPSLISRLFFLHLVLLLGPIYWSVITQRPKWRHRSRFLSLTSDIRTYFLICTRLGRVIQYSASPGTCFQTRLLRGSSRRNNNYIGLKSKVFIS